MSRLTAASISAAGAFPSTQKSSAGSRQWSCPCLLSVPFPTQGPFPWRALPRVFSTTGPSATLPARPAPRGVPVAACMAPAGPGGNQLVVPSLSFRPVGGLPLSYEGSAPRVRCFEACSAFTHFTFRPAWSLGLLTTSSPLGRLRRFRLRARVGSRIVRGPSARVLQLMSLPPCTALAATGWGDSCRMGFAPTRNARLSTAHAGNHVSLIRTARSAILAVSPKSDSVAPKQRQYRLQLPGSRGSGPWLCGVASKRWRHHGPAAWRRCGTGLHDYREKPQVLLARAFPPGFARVVASVETFPRVTRSRRNTEGWKTCAAWAGTSTGSNRSWDCGRCGPLRCRTLKVPNPRIAVPSPRSSASFTVARKASTTSPHSFLVTLGPTTSTTCSTRSALVMSSSTPHPLASPPSRLACLPAPPHDSASRAHHPPRQVKSHDGLPPPRRESSHGVTAPPERRGSSQ